MWLLNSSLALPTIGLLFGKFDIYCDNIQFNCVHCLLRTKQEEMGAQHKHNAKNETQFTSRNFYVSVNCAILAALFIVSLARGLGFYWICVQASQKIHDSMFKGLISTSMYFFNKNSSGRILNRFVKDLG